MDEIKAEWTAEELDYLTEVESTTKTTQDWVMVVRCKDCRHRGKELCLMYYVDEGGFGYDLTRDSDYCVFGERKVDADE